jgi:hypothetical protein
LNLNASGQKPSGKSAASPMDTINFIVYESLGELMDILRDFWGFLRVRKKFWLLPIILIMLLFGGLIVFSGGSALAPFIYTLF